MLFAFQKKVGVVDVFINIIYHGKAVFSSARVRVCEDFSRKKTKIAGNGLCRRFDTMLGNEKFAKETRYGEVDSFNFFDKMSRSSLEISAFGCILYQHTVCGRSKMVMLQLPKLATPVRFRSPAPFFVWGISFYFVRRFFASEQSPTGKILGGYVFR